MFGVSKLSVAFGFILVAVTAYFLSWGFEYTNHNNTTIFAIATFFGIFMAFNIGGNDVANSFGTSVGAGTLTIKQALAVAAVFEVSGAVLAGGAVTKTIRKGIVDLSSMPIEPMQFAYIMMSALFGAAIWLLIATKKGWPVSTTHSIIGGIVGSSITLGIIISGGAEAFSLVKWDKIGTIAFSWVLSPVLGGLVSFLLFSQIKKHILSYNEIAKDKLKKLKKKRKEYKKQYKKDFEALSKKERDYRTEAMSRDAHTVIEKDFDPEELETEYYKELYKIEKEREALKENRALENWIPIVAALGSVVISGMLLFKGLKHMELGFSTLMNYLIMGMVCAVVWMATFIFAKTLKSDDLDKSTYLMFSWLQVFTASGFAFSHGSNDIANAIGPFAAILEILRTGEVSSSAPVPMIAMITFGVALIVGLWFIGKEVIKTVGTNLTSIHPASGFAAELSAAAVVMAASVLGLPVSSTHILIGAVLGIGLVNKNANWDLMKPIGLAWVITLPAAAIISSFAFVVLSKFF